MINVMTGRKLHMTDSNLLQLITSFIFGIFWQGFPCFTVSAVNVFYIYIYLKSEFTIFSQVPN